MKRFVFMLMLSVVLVLSACAGELPAQNATSTESLAVVSPPDSAAPDVQPPVEETVYEQPVYSFKNAVREKSFVAKENGQTVATYSYSIPLMQVENPDNLSESDREAAQRNVTVFNTEMERILGDAISFGESLGEELLLLYTDEQQDWIGCDEKSWSANQAGEIISIHIMGYYNGGGAHPYSYSVSHTFDLSLGQFIDPAQIGDDPETFRTGVALLLIEQAEGLGEEYVDGYWSDYRDIIFNWNDTTVLFDENGMRVLFSAYELGPYAMGPVELFLSYDEMAEAMGPGGLAHLGAAQ